MKKSSAFAFAGVASALAPLVPAGGAPVAASDATPVAPAPAATESSTAARACTPSGLGTLVDQKDLMVATSTPAGTVKVGTVFLWYDATCRMIRTSYITERNCEYAGDLAPLSCGSVALWRSPDNTLRQNVAVPYGGNKAITSWYDDAGIQHYGKATSPAIAGVAPATSVATIAY